MLRPRLSRGGRLKACFYTNFTLLSDTNVHLYFSNMLILPKSLINLFHDIFYSENA